MENAHKGWMVTYYFRVSWSAIHPFQFRDSLLLISMKRVRGLLPSLYLSKNWLKLLYSDMKQTQIGNLQNWGYNSDSEHPHFYLPLCSPEWSFPVDSPATLCAHRRMDRHTHIRAHTPFAFHRPLRLHLPRADSAIVASGSNFHWILEPVLITLSKQGPWILCY